MYRDERDALLARVRTLEAQIDAERAAREAAEARELAQQARFAEERQRRRRLASDFVGWWGRPWVAIAVSALLATGVYAALRASQERARVVRVQGLASEPAATSGCPHARNEHRVVRVIERHRFALEECGRQLKGHGGEGTLELTVAPSGVAEDVRLVGHGVAQIARCVERTAMALPFPTLRGSHSITVRYALTFP